MVAEHPAFQSFDVYVRSVEPCLAVAGIEVHRRQPLVHLFRSIYAGRTSKYAAAIGNEEARKVVQSALDAVRLLMLFAGTAGVIWSVWKYHLKRQLRCC